MKHIMAFRMSDRLWMLMAAITTTVLAAGRVVQDDFGKDFDITWGGDGRHAVVTDNGMQMQLSLDRSSGGAFQSNHAFLFGKFDMQMKLVKGNSAGTVTTLYLSSTGGKHDEIDMEFLGNKAGQPYVLNTNIFAEGEGEREERFNLWFDPTTSFHSYSILWIPSHIIFLVDDTPIRIYTKTSGVAFPSSQAMRVYGTLWNGDAWATQGGHVKTDWSLAPFQATYRDFQWQECSRSASSLSSSPTCVVSTQDKWWNQLSASSSSSSPPSLAGKSAVSEAMKKLRWVQRKYRIYSYCSDLSRFHGVRPADCTSSS